MIRVKRGIHRRHPPRPGGGKKRPHGPPGDNRRHRGRGARRRRGDRHRQYRRRIQLNHNGSPSEARPRNIVVDREAAAVVRGGVRRPDGKELSRERARGAVLGRVRRGRAHKAGPIPTGHPAPEDVGAYRRRAQGHRTVRRGVSSLETANTAKAGVRARWRAATMAPPAAGQAARPPVTASSHHRAGAKHPEGRRRSEPFKRAEPGTAVAERGRRVGASERRARHAQIVAITLRKSLEEYGDTGRLQDRGSMSSPGNEGRLVSPHQGRQREGRVRQL